MAAPQTFDGRRRRCVDSTPEAEGRTAAAAIDRGLFDDFDASQVKVFDNEIRDIDARHELSTYRESL